MNQFFYFMNTRKGPHLKLSAINGCKMGNYRYASLLLCTGNFTKGKRFMDCRTGMPEVDKCWRKIGWSSHEFDLVEEEQYGCNMLLILPPKSCLTNNLYSRYVKCFYYKLMIRNSYVSLCRPPPYSSHHFQAACFFFYVTLAFLCFHSSFNVTIITILYYKLHVLLFQVCLFFY